MAVVSNSKESSFQKKKRGFGSSGKSRRGLVRNILTVIGIIFVVLCLFGVINQVAVGHSYFSWLIDRGYETGEALNSLVKQEDQSPVKITDEGVYVNGFEPDSANPLLPDANEVDAQNKE